MHEVCLNKMINLIATIVGWIGMFLIMLAYLLLSTEKLISYSWPYHLMNFFGGTGLMMNTLVNRAWPTMALNIVWALIALISFVKIIKKKKK